MIKVVNLTKKTKDKTIIDNLNYDFLPSNLYQIRGLNGTGKSTLLKLLGGIVEPTDGLIFYGNKKLDENTLVDLKQHSICYIDQVHDLIYHKTVLFNLQLESYILNKDVEMETIKTALEKFGLGDKLQTKIRNLSGGERRIISFLKGYLSHKDIILYVDDSINSWERGQKLRISFENGLSLNNTNGVFMFYIYTDSTDKLNTGYIYNKSVGIISPDIFSNNSKPIIEIICIDNTNLDFVIDVF